MDTGLEHGGPQSGGPCSGPPVARPAHAYQPVIKDISQDIRQKWDIPGVAGKKIMIY